MDILNDNDKYANALNRAKKELQKDNYEATSLAIKRIFPELNESTDKSIRDSLIRYFQEKKNCVGDTWAGMNVDDVLDWLKRQIPQEDQEKENTNKKISKSSEVLSKALIDELVKEKIESYPNYWRSGQKVFNALEEVLLKATKYERNIAREVQTIDKVDCFYNDENIVEFLDRCYSRYKNWFETNKSKQ